MAEFRLLRAGQNQLNEWSALINSLPIQSRDLHFLPEYFEIYKKTHGVEYAAAITRENQNWILTPFIFRGVDLRESVEVFNSTHFYDLTNPYGYGGPIGSLNLPPELVLAHLKFIEAIS